MNSIHDAIDSFGSQTSLARALQVPVQTVNNWARVGRIPPWRQAAVQAALEQHRRETARSQPRRRRA